MEEESLRVNLTNYLNPTLTEVTSAILDICFFASTLLFPIILYLIFHEKSMGKYRWYILNSIVWDYAYDLLLGVVKPVLFLPAMGGYSQYKQFQRVIQFPRGAGTVFVLLGAWIIINWGLSVTISIIFRFSQSAPGKLSDFFDRSKGVYAFYFVLHMCFYVCFEGMLVAACLYTAIDGVEASSLYADCSNFENANMVFLFRRTSATDAFWVLIIFVLLLLFSIGVSLWIALLRRLRRSSVKKLQSYRLQIMLFRAFTVQIIVAYVCLLFPLLAASILVALGSKAAQAAGNVYLILSSMHAVLDSIAVLYFITPYRRLLLRRLQMYSAWNAAKQYQRSDRRCAIAGSFAVST